MNDPELLILREFVAHEAEFVSGAALARQLGVSRVAVWQHMNRLRARGFAFTGVQAKGYRMTRTPPYLHDTLIRAHMRHHHRDFSLTVRHEVDSTNDEAARQLSAGRETPFVILACRQTKGRGRFGRSWSSDDPGSLYASFAFRPRIAPARMQTFTLWMGASLCELITNFCHIQAGLKWPNDILFDGRKAGGMLTEARIDADEIRDLVFGLGLNVNRPADSWPPELAARATSIAAQTGAPVDLNRFTAALIGRVALAYNQFVAGDHLATFAEAWHRHDLLRGRTVTLLQGDRRITGAATGIDDQGALLLRTKDGRVQRFAAGEVSLEKSA